MYNRIAQGNGSPPTQPDIPPQTHVLVRWGRVPVDPSDRQLTGLRRKDLDREHVLSFAPQQGFDLELEISIGTDDFVSTGNLSPIEPDIRAIVDTVELERGVRA